VQFAEYGAPEVLRVVDVDEPDAGPGQIRVAVRAAGINPIDCKIRSGAMRQMMQVELPSIPGVEVAGVVDELGDGLSGVSVGDAVFGFALSALAQRSTTPWWGALRSQAGGHVLGRGSGAAGSGRDRAVRTLDLLGVKARDTVLINGAAGGVGVAATQFARARGAAVIGKASQNNHDFVRFLGASPTTYGEGLVGGVSQMAPDGVELALDTAAHGAALPDLIEITGRAPTTCSPSRTTTLTTTTASG
jgi:NADPH:quinone reductase-like Zn-dependent oxidoreductase